MAVRAMKADGVSDVCVLGRGGGQTDKGLTVCCTCCSLD